MGQHLYTYNDPPSERDLAQILRVLEDDGVVAYPTDQNWAFGCDASSSKALDRIHRLKPSHPKDRPFALICASISMAADVANIDNAAYRVLRRAWPGAYTVLLNAGRNLPRQIKDKRRIVGVRIPSCALLLAVVERFGKPLASTSVPEIQDPVEPKSGFMRPPRFGYEVQEVYGHALDLVIDLGSELTGQESTVVDMSQGFAEIVRVGAGDPAVFVEPA
jgi:tRNA threonylcarbamoyl adenosine modification protein (Sua5/YciO/YrdC/YwlC family)